MKIVKAFFWTENIPLTRPYTIAYKTISAVENIFVRLETENGQWGIGQASPSEQVVKESFDDTRAALSANLEALVLHENIYQFESLQRKVHQTIGHRPGACAAVDIALYDLFCKNLGIPIANYLGQVHHKLPTSITIGIKSIAETLEEAKEYMERGFKILKLKIGKSVEEDVACLLQLNELVNGKMKIRVDANQGYQTADLLSFVKQTEKVGLELIEQPLAAGNDTQLDTLPREIKKILAADESLIGTMDAFRLAQSQQYGIFNIKLMKCGGIHSSQRMADYAQQAGIDLMWGCNDESCVSIAAALHSAFACPNTRYIDLDGSFDLQHDPFEGGFIIEDGWMRIGEGHGLGVKKANS